MGIIGVIWGIGGIAVMLGMGAYKLFGIALLAFDHDLGWIHWTFTACFLVFMAYGKAYMGFQRNLAPRIAARARYLRENPGFFSVLLAPLFCMGYFYAERRKMIAIWLITAIMISFVILMQSVPQPWRSLIDMGVSLGLFWGFVTTLYFSFRALTQEEFPHSAYLPTA